MDAQMEVKLENVKLHGFHGLQKGEDVLGGEFEINLSAYFIAKEFPITLLENSVDYSAIYAIVKQRMSQPTPLLETLAMDIVSEVFEKYPIVEEVKISISKLKPPIPSFRGSVGVGYSIKRSS